jgi:hypothetical protein
MSKTETCSCWYVLLDTWYDNIVVCDACYILRYTNMFYKWRHPQSLQLTLLTPVTTPTLPTSQDLSSHPVLVNNYLRNQLVRDNMKKAISSGTLFTIFQLTHRQSRNFEVRINNDMRNLNLNVTPTHSSPFWRQKFGKRHSISYINWTVLAIATVWTVRFCVQI